MKTLSILLIIVFALLICVNISRYIHTFKYHKKQIENLNDLLFKTKHKQIILNQQLKILRISEDDQKSNLYALYTRMNELVETFLNVENK